MKRPVTSSIPDQPASTTSIPVQHVVKTDVTGTENPEKTLVVETPAGERNETGQVDTLQDDIDAVEPLQTVMDKDDTLNDTVPSTSNTPDMPNGMANVQQRAHCSLSVYMQQLRTRAACEDEMVPLHENRARFGAFTLSRARGISHQSPLNLVFSFLEPDLLSLSDQVFPQVPHIHSVPFFLAFLLPQLGHLFFLAISNSTFTRAYVTGLD